MATRVLEDVSRAQHLVDDDLVDILKFHFEGIVWRPGISLLSRPSLRCRGTQLKTLDVYSP